jgi:hypothetical protein
VDQVIGEPTLQMEDIKPHIDLTTPEVNLSETIHEDASDDIVQQNLEQEVVMENEEHQ